LIISVENKDVPVESTEVTDPVSSREILKIADEE